MADPVMDISGQPELDAASDPMPIEPPVKQAPRRMIKVRAMRAGFIYQERKVEGDRFEVQEHELGSWMECDEKHEQKKHLERQMAKKKAVNAKAVKEDRLLADV